MRCWRRACPSSAVLQASVSLPSRAKDRSTGIGSCIWVVPPCRVPRPHAALAVGMPLDLPEARLDLYVDVPAPPTPPVCPPLLLPRSDLRRHNHSLSLHLPHGARCRCKAGTSAAWEECTGRWKPREPAAADFWLTDCGDAAASGSASVAQKWAASNHTAHPLTAAAPPREQRNERCDRSPAERAGARGRVAVPLFRREKPSPPRSTPTPSAPRKGGGRPACSPTRAKKMLVSMGWAVQSETGEGGVTRSS